MSRYSLRPLAARADLFEVAVGWDAGLSTYFVILFGAPGGNTEPEVRLRRGTRPFEIIRAAEIIEVSAAYAEIPADLARRLERDRRSPGHKPGRRFLHLFEKLFSRSVSRPQSQGSRAMSNCYTNCCFAMEVTPGEAGLLREALALAEFLEDEPDAAATAERWSKLSDDFRAGFAPLDDDPVSGFLAIFPDRDYPTFGSDFAFEDQADGLVNVLVTSEQFEPDAVAALLRRTITASLPVAASWSYDSDRHRVDAFGGGAFRVDEAGIHWIETSKAHESEHFTARFVLTTRDPEEGLLFWNNAAGFGPLASADIFTGPEAKALPTVIADDEPEWIQLPRGLHL